MDETFEEVRKRMAIAESEVFRLREENSLLVDAVNDWKRAYDKATSILTPPQMIRLQNIFEADLKKLSKRRVSRAKRA